jgi:hypothetical protein
MITPFIEWLLSFVKISAVQDMLRFGVTEFLSELLTITHPPFSAEVKERVEL